MSKYLTDRLNAAFIETALTRKVGQEVIADRVIHAPAYWVTSAPGDRPCPSLQGDYMTHGGAYLTVIPYARWHVAANDS